MYAVVFKSTRTLGANELYDQWSEITEKLVRQIPGFIDFHSHRDPVTRKGVTVAYLERYTFCGATGLTAAMPDSDGNKAGVPDLDKYFDAIKTAPDVDALKKVYLAALEAVKKEGRKDQAYLGGDGVF